MIITDPVYGEQEITDPLVIELINTPEMQRLKGVNQYGVWDLLEPKFFTSRFEHSLGVFFLLKKLGASYEEQLAGLLHDIAHTAFSHVIDYVYNAHTSQHIHEDFHEKVIHSSAIPSILKKHGLDINYIINEKNFTLLEKEIPELCADRLDYFFRDSLKVGINSGANINLFLSSVVIAENRMLLNNKSLAKKMALDFIKMGSILWSPPVQSGSFQLMADIIKAAMAKNVISEKDFFLTDSELLNILKKDPELNKKVSLISYNHIKEGTKGNYTFHTFSKPRFINPEVIISNSIKRIADIDNEVAQSIKALKDSLAKGYYINIEGFE